MADANPSRPRPQRVIVDGKAESAQPESRQEEAAALGAADAAEEAVRPRVGEFNDRGARVQSVDVTSKGILRVNYK